MSSAFTIPVAVAVTIGLAEADAAFHKHPLTIKPVIGGFIMGMFLYAISELDTRLGNLFAALIVVNALIQHGDTVFSHLGKVH